METNVNQLEVFIRWADVVLMTYAVTDPASFMLATHLLGEIQKLRPLCYRYINGHRYLSSNNYNTNNDTSNNSSTGPNGSELKKSQPKKCCDSCQDLPVVIVATKVDLIEKRLISEENGISMSHTTGCVSYREVSVKNTQDDSKGVCGIFEEAVRRGWLYRQHCVLSRNKYLSLSRHNSRNRNVQIQVPKTFLPTPIIIKSTDCFIDQSNTACEKKDDEKTRHGKEGSCKDKFDKEMMSMPSTPKHGKKLLRRKSLADWLRKLKLKSPEEGDKNSDRHEENEEDQPDFKSELKFKKRRASIGNFLISK
ncbi:uncharacterized protein [Lepeophtheirus salmonis]|uniref:uncharacterized protein n=1 Tax=Lepeophtheirus salmonis TaxID=72036 RepID=UPI003AF353A0